MGLALSVLRESPACLSISQRAFQFILRMLPIKRVFDWPGGKAGFNRICERERNISDRGPHSVPRDVKHSIDCSMMPFDLCHTHLMKTRSSHGSSIGQEEAPHLTIIFIHGGAYVLNIWDSHLRGASELIKELSKSHSKRCHLVLPEYPLAPRSSCEQMLQIVEKLYRRVEATTTGPIVLMGDSAGGGLALLLAQRLAEAKSAGEAVKQPDGLLLLSPWLDVSMSDSRSAKLERLDCFLKLGFLLEAGRSFAGGVDTRDHKASPLFGTMKGLPPLSIWTSTHDLLLPDSQRLHERIREEDPKQRVRYVEEPGLLHDWWMWGQAEGAKTIREMANAIVEDLALP